MRNVGLFVNKNIEMDNENFQKKKCKFFVYKMLFEGVNMSMRYLDL